MRNKNGKPRNKNNRIGSDANKATGVLNMMAILLDPVSEYRLRTLIAATGRSEQALLQEAITDSLESLQDQMGGDSELERRERGEDWSRPIVTLAHSRDQDG
jgi:predicted DNA-binding protein